MSLMIVNSDSPESTTIDSCSCWAGVSSVSKSKRLIPRMAFIGVRISWLMFAKKTLLARLAASAASFARCSSSWVCLRCVTSRATQYSNGFSSETLGTRHDNHL